MFKKRPKRATVFSRFHSGTIMASCQRRSSPNAPPPQSHKSNAYLPASGASWCLIWATRCVCVARHTWALCVALFPARRDAIKDPENGSGSHSQPAQQQQSSWVPIPAYTPRFVLQYIQQRGGLFTKVIIIRCGLLVIEGGFFWCVN